MTIMQPSSGQTTTSIILTLNQAVGARLTPLQYARILMGKEYYHAPDNWVNFVLWNRTAYPLSPWTHTAKQLHAYVTEPKNEDGLKESIPDFNDPERMKCYKMF